MIISPKDLYVLYLRLHKSHGWNSVLTFSQRCDASLLAEIQSWQKGLNMNFPFGCAIAHILHLPLAFSWGFHNAMCMCSAVSAMHVQWRIIVPKMQCRRAAKSTEKGTYPLHWHVRMYTSRFQGHYTNAISTIFPWPRSTMLIKIIIYIYIFSFYLS